MIHVSASTLYSLILKNKKRPPLHLGVVAIEKGAFGSPSTMVANFTYLHNKDRGLG